VQSAKADALRPQHQQRKARFEIESLSLLKRWFFLIKTKI